MTRIQVMKKVSIKKRANKLDTEGKAINEDQKCLGNFIIIFLINFINYLFFILYRPTLCYTFIWININIHTGIYFTFKSQNIQFMSCL